MDKLILALEFLPKSLPVVINGFQIAKADEPIQSSSCIIFNPQEKIFEIDTSEYLLGERVVFKVKTENGDFMSKLVDVIKYYWTIRYADPLESLMMVEYEDNESISMPVFKFKPEIIQKLKEPVRFDEHSLKRVIDGINFILKSNAVYTDIHTESLPERNIVEIVYEQDKFPVQTDGREMLFTGNGLVGGIKNVTNYYYGNIKHATKVKIISKNLKDVETLNKELIEAIQNKKEIFTEDEILKRIKYEIAITGPKSIFFQNQLLFNKIKELIANSSPNEAIYSYERTSWIDSPKANKHRSTITLILEHVTKTINRVFERLNLVRYGFYYYNLKLYQCKGLKILTFKKRHTTSLTQSIAKWISDYALVNLFYHEFQ